MAEYKRWRGIQLTVAILPEDLKRLDAFVEECKPLMPRASRSLLLRAALRLPRPLLVRAMSKESDKLVESYRDMRKVKTDT